MVGTVARATHKHFRDVNKRVRAQRAAIEVVSRLPHVRSSLYPGSAPSRTSNLPPCLKKD